MSWLLIFSEYLAWGLYPFKSSFFFLKQIWEYNNSLQRSNYWNLFNLTICCVFSMIPWQSFIQTTTAFPLKSSLFGLHSYFLLCSLDFSTTWNWPKSPLKILLSWETRTLFKYHDVILLILSFMLLWNYNLAQHLQLW